MNDLETRPKLHDKVYINSKESQGIIVHICIKKYAGLIATIKFNDDSEKMYAVHNATWDEKNGYWIN